MKLTYISKSQYKVIDGILTGCAFILDGFILVLSFGKLNGWFSSIVIFNRLRIASEKYKAKHKLRSAMIDTRVRSLEHEYKDTPYMAAFIVISIILYVFVGIIMGSIVNNDDENAPIGTCIFAGIVWPIVFFIAAGIHLGKFIYNKWLK